MTVTETETDEAITFFAARKVSLGCRHGRSREPGASCHGDDLLEADWARPATVENKDVVEEELR